MHITKKTIILICLLLISLTITACSKEIGPKICVGEIVELDLLQGTVVLKPLTGPDEVFEHEKIHLNRKYLNSTYEPYNGDYIEVVYEGKINTEDGFSRFVTVNSAVKCNAPTIPSTEIDTAISDD